MISSSPLDERRAGSSPLADPVAEARRIVDAGREQGIVVRAVGGTAVYLQSPGHRPLLPRALKDIDLVTTRADGAATERLLAELGYVGDEMFNALRGARRQVHRDPLNGRDLDVFVGEFVLCHELPIADRLDRDPYTVPLAELMLTKLQVVELNERDQRDIYSLCHHHEVTDGDGSGIEADVIAALCAGDWGLWRTCTGTIERCRADLARYDVDVADQELIDARLGWLAERIEAAPKTGRWKRRGIVGERKRWYQEPEED